MVFFAFDEKKATTSAAWEARLAGDYTESPANRRCFLILAGVTYCLLPVLPVLGAGVVVLLPPLLDPMPLELGEVGLVVVPLELEPEPLVLLPEAPLPALPLDEVPLRASSMHLSRSAPVRPTHLLASLPDAPDAAPVEPAVPEVELSLLPEDELPEADGVLVLLPEEPAPALPAPEAPELPEPEPEDCENATPDSARSAAAVAAVRVFNIMERSPSKGG
jgi:hypothetical protein